MPAMARPSRGAPDNSMVKNASGPQPGRALPNTKSGWTLEVWGGEHNP